MSDKISISPLTGVLPVHRLDERTPIYDAVVADLGLPGLVTVAEGD